MLNFQYHTQIKVITGPRGLGGDSNDIKWFEWEGLQRGAWLQEEPQEYEYG